MTPRTRKTVSLLISHLAFLAIGYFIAQYTQGDTKPKQAKKTPPKVITKEKIVEKRDTVVIQAEQSQNNTTESLNRVIDSAVAQAVDSILQSFDSLSIDYSDTAYADYEGDTNWIMEQTDAYLEDSVFEDLVKESKAKSIQEISVKKETLIQSLRIMPTPIDSATIVQANSSIDSLLSTLAKIKTVESQEFTIEYWKSPLNFKGYKFANRKVQLFGLDSVDKACQIFLTDPIILKNAQRFYILKETYEYLPYQEIKREKVLQLIND